MSADIIKIIIGLILLISVTWYKWNNNRSKIRKNAVKFLKSNKQLTLKLDFSNAKPVVSSW